MDSYRYFPAEFTVNKKWPVLDPTWAAALCLWVFFPSTKFRIIVLKFWNYLKKSKKRWPALPAPFLKIRLFVKHIQHSPETLENNIWKLSHRDVMENSSPKLEHHPATESGTSRVQQSRTAIPGGHSNGPATEHTVPGNGIIRDTLKHGEKFGHTRATTF